MPTAPALRWVPGCAARLEIPGARLLILPGVSPHFAMWEKPKEFNQAVLAGGAGLLGDESVTRRPGTSMTKA